MNLGHFGGPFYLLILEVFMDKLLELENKLKLAKAELSKIMSSGTTATGSVNSTGGSSLASQIGFGKAEEKEEDKKKKKHEDEKEDKKLIANAIDKHNEDKHGEDKDENSAQKEMGLEKAGGPNKFGERQTAIAENVNREQRAPATEIHPETGEKKLITPDQQVKAQVDAKAAKKAKFEAEAKARREEYRKQGLVKFDKNGQWSMDKDC
jgi:hypothetical protein